MRRVALATAFMVILTAGVAQAETRYVSAKEGLRIRSEPSEDAEILSVLPFASEVDGEIKDGWMQTDEGYLKVEHLAESNPLDEYQYLGEWKLTAYFETGLQTASGVWPEVNVTVAHNSLPFGTQIYIENQGFWVVQDRGPSSMGENWCDLYLGDYGTCVQFGEKYAKVYLVTEEKP